MDAEPDCWQMNVDLVADFLAHECVPSAQGLRHKASGRRVSGLLPVHILGHPVDLDPLAELAGQHGLFMIEDATESLGARYRGKNAGAIGHLACFSFNGNKVITTGGGGMITTNNAAFAAKARHLTTQAKADPVEYIHDEIGYNYRLTNIQAAMGCAQLERLEEFIAAKRRIARTYREAFAAVPGLEFMPQSDWAESTYWLSSVKIRADDFGLDSRAVMRKLGEHQIQSRPLWQPINLSPAYRELKAPPCPVAAALYREVLSLPSSVGLQASDQQRVIETMLALGSDAGRKRSHC
jgi:perosamine synthetase